MKISTRIKCKAVADRAHPIYEVTLTLNSGKVYVCESICERAGENKCYAMARKEAQKDANNSRNA